MEVHRHRSLPGGRAVVGGVLIAMAALGVFLAYDEASRRPTEPVVVAARGIRVGEVLGPDDLATADADLPPQVASTSFRSVEALVGRVALGPIGEGEMVQHSSVSDQAATPGIHEVALTLPRPQIAVSRLKVGERVDVFVSDDVTTATVVRGAEVVDIDAGDSGALTSDREITLVVAVPDGEAVAAVVHALRTGEVTVVRSTFATAGSDQQPLVFDAAGEIDGESDGDG